VKQQKLALNMQQQLLGEVNRCECQSELRRKAGDDIRCRKREKGCGVRRLKDWNGWQSGQPGVDHGSFRSSRGTGNNIQARSTRDNIQPRSVLAPTDFSTSSSGMSPRLEL
jgi:hypothetical protein